MSPDLYEIAQEFGLTEEALMTESVRLYLAEHLRMLEVDRQARCAKFGVNDLEEMDNLLRRGEVEEEAIREDLEEVSHLTYRIQRVKALFEDLPPPPRDPLPTLDEIRQTLKDQLPALKENYSVKSMGIFGPYATGKARPYDSVGVLVEFYETPGLAFFGLEQELGEALGVRVHLATRGGLWPDAAKRIMSELVSV